MSIGWIDHERFLQHETGPSHPERPQRLRSLVIALERAGLLARMQPLPFTAATPDDLCLVHEPAYVELVRMSCDLGIGFVGSMDTPVCRHSFDAASLAVGGVLAACDAVMEGRVDRAFCAVRPPGHHAERDRALGFCLFNNVAIAAEHLIRRRQLQRVAIVDFDVHHGNGTQHAFEDRSDVFYFSVHESSDTLSFPGSGDENEKGRDTGTGYTLNIPVAAGSDDEVYRAVFREKILPALGDFEPQFLLISAGFDAVAEDTIANVNLTPECYGGLTEELMRAARDHGKGRVVSVLEGGYALDALGRSAAAHVTALMEVPTAR